MRWCCIPGAAKVSTRDAAIEQSLEMRQRHLACRHGENGTDNVSHHLVERTVEVEVKAVAAASLVVNTHFPYRPYLLTLALQKLLLYLVARAVGKGRKVVGALCGRKRVRRRE